MESTTSKKRGRPRKVKEPNPSPSASPAPAPAPAPPQPQEIIVDLRPTKRMGRPMKVKEPYPSPALAPPQMVKIKHPCNKQVDKEAIKLRLSSSARQKKVEKQHNYRSNIEASSKLLQSFELTSKQLKMLKKSPFYNMYISFIMNPDINHRKSDMVTRDLISCYDPDKDKFKLGSKFVRLTPNDVKVIFGIVCGDKKLNFKSKGSLATCGLTQRNFPDGDSRITKLKLKILINGLAISNEDDSVEDFVKLVTVYSLATLFLPSTGDIIPHSFFQYVDDINEIRSYNWAEAIKEKLMDSIRKDYRTPNKVVGCVAVLSYWFYEHTILSLRERSVLPRIMMWDLPLKVENFKRDVIDKLTAKEVKKKELVLTKAEEEMFARADISENEEEEEREEDNDQERDNEKERGENDSLPNPSVPSQESARTEIIVSFRGSTTRKRMGRPRKVKEIMLEELKHCSHHNRAGSDNSSPHEKLTRVAFDPEPQILTLEYVSDIAARLFDDSPNYDEDDSMFDAASVKVDEYTVTKETAPLLKSILAKQGNIAMNCVAETTTIRSSLLENVCGLYQKLEKKDPKTVKVSEVKSMLAEVRDFEKVKLDVKWLRERLEDIAKTLEESEDYSMMQEEVDKNNQDAERKSKELEELEAKTHVARDELATIEARGIKLCERLSDTKANWASFCEKSLVEGLL